MVARSPRIGIYGLTGCAGDQLTILNCEDELMDILKAVDISSFLMAQSDNEETELDIALVEGSVSSEDDLSMLREIRKRTKTLIAIGGCACLGGPQAGRAIDHNWKERMKRVYGTRKFEITPPLEPKPLSAHVEVDLMIPGCPIDKGEFLRAVSRLVRADTPIAYRYPVCVECKYNENECLLFKNVVCLGPVTVAGCDSICINHNLPCVGCRGPVIEANIAAEIDMVVDMDHPLFKDRKRFSLEDVKNRAMLFGGTEMVSLLEKARRGRK